MKRLGALAGCVGYDEAAALLTWCWGGGGGSRRKMHSSGGCMVGVTKVPSSPS